MFNIFIKDPYAKRFQKDEKITKTSYIANSGGLLGLCMGFSLISGAEILFHAIFGIFSVILPSMRGAAEVAASASNKAYSRSESGDEGGDVDGELGGEEEVVGGELETSVNAEDSVEATDATMNGGGGGGGGGGGCCRKCCCHCSNLGGAHGIHGGGTQAGLRQRHQAGSSVEGDAERLYLLHRQSRNFPSHHHHHHHPDMLPGDFESPMSLPPIPMSVVGHHPTRPSSSQLHHATCQTSAGTLNNGNSSGSKASLGPERII